MDESFTSVLNTPIKKIQELTIHSPIQNRPIVYPDLNDITTSSTTIGDSMADKGYSQTLSSAVLRELDTRANEISTKISFAPAASQNSAMKMKRFAGAHKPMFLKMESISSHYAAARKKEKEANHARKELHSSATKKRRTLNGPEEIFGSGSLNSSPVRRRESQSPTAEYRRGAPLPSINTNPFSGQIPSLRAKKTNIEPPSSPLRSPESSPLKFTRISPSRGSMNLNQLLLDDSSSDFVKPAGPVKVRQTSLEMAGVKPSASARSLNLKASSSSLHKKTSHTSLSERSVPRLQNKSFVPTLNKRPSFSTLEKKSTGARLQLPAHPIGSHLQTENVASLSSSPKKFGHRARDSQSSSDSSAHESFDTTANKLFSLRSNTAGSGDTSFLSRPEIRLHTTSTTPFSLYSKPTISSSQKSLDPTSSLHSFPSQKSLNLQASQRSMNRFQRFKTRFA